MSSKEDYLDELLKNLTKGTDNIKSGTENKMGTLGREEREEEKTADEYIQPVEELEAETETAVFAADAGPELPLPEYEMGSDEASMYPEAELPDMTELLEGTESPDAMEAELPDMMELPEGTESPDAMEAELPEGTELLEGTDLPDVVETGQIDAEEKIPEIEELITSMDGDISGMDEKNLTDDMGSDLGDLEGLTKELEAGSADSVQGPDLNDVAAMSEEDIAKLLSDGFDGEDAAGVDSSDQDVLDMLEGTEDADLQDIQDMLQKSDNNEAVDDEIVKLLEGVPEGGEELREKILSEDEAEGGNSPEELDALVLDPKKKKELEKKRRKAEKAAKKKAAKAEKKAKKVAKQSKKNRKNKNVQDIPVDAYGEELLFDIDELDALVSKAGKIGDEEAEAEDEDNAQDDAGAEDLGIDLDNLFVGGEDDGESASQADGQPESDEAKAADGKKKEKKTPKAQKTKKVQKEKAERAGFLTKILSFLMEEDEEDEKKENLRLSEENQEILDDLDKQGKSVKGGKGGTGGKKDKKKDAKKEKPKKEAKPKKAPKPKPEKPPKEPEPYVPPRKRLTPKKVLPVVLLGITVAASLLIFVNVTTDYVDKRAAKSAYYNGDYLTCYQNLNGKELNETEAVMYGRSESILYIRLWYREYEMFVEEGSEVEALDSLIQTVKDYPMLYEYASRWNAEGDVYVVYADILNVLLDKYGLTELQAKEIAKERDDYEYTRMVIAIAEGKPYGSWNQPEASDEDAPLQHELPEESGLGQGNFVDNR